MRNVIGESWTKKNRNFDKRWGSNNSFYCTKAWLKLRHYILMKEPLCVECLKEGIYEGATEVDHIIPLEDDWSLRLDVDNCQPLCSHHHRVKSAIDVSERKKRLKREIGNIIMDELEE